MQSREKHLSPQSAVLFRSKQTLGTALIFGLVLVVFPNGAIAASKCSMSSGFLDGVWPDECNDFQEAAEEIDTTLVTTGCTSTNPAAQADCLRKAKEASEGLKNSSQIHKWSQRAGFVAVGASVSKHLIKKGNDRKSLESSAKLHKAAGTALNVAGAVDISLALKALLSEKKRIDSIQCAPTNSNCLTQKANAQGKIQKAMGKAYLMGGIKIAGGLMAIEIGKSSQRKADLLGDVEDIIYKFESLSRRRTHPIIGEATLVRIESSKEADYREYVKDNHGASMEDYIKYLEGKPKTFLADTSKEPVAQGVMDLDSSDGGFGKAMESLTSSNKKSPASP